MIATAAEATWVVVIERKAAGASLGLELNSMRGVLLVDAVKKQGAVGEYNAAHPSMALEPGDEILRVNNINKKPVRSPPKTGGLQWVWRRAV